MLHAAVDCPAQMLTLGISRGREAIEEIAGEWDQLVAKTEAAVFTSPGWYVAWADAFQPRDRDLSVITARQDGRLIGVLPLSRTRTDARGLYLPLVAPLGYGDYNPPIVDPAAAAVALPQMLELAFAHFGNRGVYWWPNFPCQDPSLNLFYNVLAAHGMSHVQESDTASRLRLDGMDFEAVERSWRPNHRLDIRRRRKRLAEHGPVSLWQPRTLAEAEPILQEFFTAYDERWLSQGYPGKFQDPRERLHYRSMLRRLWGRGLHFSTVRCGSENLSYHFGFFAGGWLQWYKPTHRVQFAAFSPGKIHIAMLVEEACRSQWKGIDFLLGIEPYKVPWSNETVDVVRIHAAFHPWAPSYLWFSRGRPYVKRRFVGQYMRTRAMLQKWRHR